MHIPALNQEGGIRCPKCSHVFPITEGILAEVRDGLAKEFESERTALLGKLESREAKIRKEADALREKEAAVAKSVEEGVARQLKGIREEEQAKAARKLESEFADLNSQLEESRSALRGAKAKELDLLKRQREVEAAREDLELEVARKLDEERKKIREQAMKHADEENQLRMAEKDKKIGDLSLKIDELKRKAEQGSVQLQGEVLELGLEGRLMEAFAGDIIEPVAKGVRGADVTQTVMSPMGRKCGSIIYETKRTKHWQGSWIGKLKEDQLAAKAQIPVIVTQALPEGIEHFGQHEGVWVCDFASAIPLAAALRYSLIEVSREQLANEGRTDKAEVLYSYITGNEFRQRIEAIVGNFAQMKTDLDKERLTAERLFKKREGLMLNIQKNIAMMFGSMEAIAGNALPPVASLECEEESSDEKAA